MADSHPVLARLRNARKSYGKLLALDDMNLQLRSGQVLALLGAVTARAGGASMASGALRVTLWGALALGITAAAGHLFGTVG